MKKTLLTILIFWTTIFYGQTTMIIGGNNTTIDNNPWQVSLRTTNNYHNVNARNIHICGGSIISPNWILTAAHCITNPNGNVIGVGEITISAGITDRNDLITGQYRNVVQIIRHPNYNASTLENDVALIELQNPLNFNNNVQPIQLTDKAFDSSPPTIARVTGWGLTTNNGNPANILQTLEMPIISNSHANSLNTGNNTVTNNMIALFLENSGVAQGDSGGPATILDEGERYLIGCSSWGEFPKDDKPTIYTRLFNYRSWIENIVPLPEIIGANLLCNSNTTYNLNNTAGTITWSSSTNIQIVSSNNTQATIKSSNSTISGNGWLRASSSDGYTITERINVNQNEGQIPMSLSVYSSSSNYIDITVNNGSGETPYSWYINNAFYTTTTSRTLTLYYTASSIRIEVKNDNVCGTGEHSAYYTGQIPGRYYYTVSPNPTSTVLKINKRSKLENSFKGSNSFKNTIQYKLYGLNNNLILNGTDLMKVNGIEIDVTTIPEGLYILEILSSDNSVETHKIIKK